MLNRVNHKIRRYPPQIPSKPFNISTCYRYCEALARSRRHNFPIGSLFSPYKLRKHIFALYAFTYQLGEYIDNPSLSIAHKELDLWESYLETCYHEEDPDHPIFAALQATIVELDLPITPFSSMIAGARLQMGVTQYPTIMDLTRYTDLSAAPMGQLFTYLSKSREPSLLRYAEQLATGIAFASFWQDIAIDLQNNMIYIPLEDFDYFEVTKEDLQQCKQSSQVTALIRYQVARTRTILEHARPLIDGIHSNLAIESALIWLGGMRILDKIAAGGSKTLLQRPYLTSTNKASIVTKALAWNGVRRFF